MKNLPSGPSLRSTRATAKDGANVSLSSETAAAIEAAIPSNAATYSRVVAPAAERRRFSSNSFASAFDWRAVLR